MSLGRRGWLAVLLVLTTLSQTTNAVGSIELQPVLSGLSSPLYLTNSRDGTDRRFIVERSGRIVVLQPGSSTPAEFLNISARLATAGSEQGLLGLAFHPQYAINRCFFVNYTRQGDGATVIAEYRTSISDPNVADPSESVILVIPQPFANHNGGMIEFGHDGYLYIATGDGGSGNDPGNRAQNTSGLLGKILRIDVDHPNGTVPYSSPATNPFFGATAGADEIYALGLRNPWRMSFDRLTGQLYAADVGQNAWEEIDIVTLGGNYGWRVFEGNHCTGIDAGLCNTSNFIFPIADYQHLNGRCSITGGYVYRGARSALPVGGYVYSDFCTGEILLLDGGVQTVLTNTSLNISSFGEDEAGEVYVVGLGGTVHQITASPVLPTCAYSITPTNSMFSSTGGLGTVAMSAGSNCNWLVASHEAWITLNGTAGGTSGGAVDYVVATNAGPARIGIITLGGQTLTVTQQAGLWSGAVDLGGGWKWLEWFGYFSTTYYPWIYHNEHGWLYSYGTDLNSIWFWDSTMSAWWWTSDTTYPYAYRAVDGAWLFYQRNSFAPRWFYNYNTPGWESW